MTVIFALLSTYAWKDQQNTDREREMSREREVQQLELSKQSIDTAQKLQAELDNLTALVAQSQSGTSRKTTPDGERTRPAAASSLEVDQLKVDVDNIKEQQKVFQIALGDDPSKRLAVVILRKDIDSLVESNKEQIANMKNDILAAHDDAKSNMEFMKWLLGAVGLSNLIAPLTTALLGRKTDPA